MKFALATIRRGHEAIPVIEVGDHHYDLRHLAPDLFEGRAEQGLIALFFRWSEIEPRLMALADEIGKSATGRGAPLDPKPSQADFLTPLQYPRKVVLVGANYYDHVHGDAGLTDFRKEDKIPTLFLKPPSTTLVGCGRTVRYPSQSIKFDWEIELAAIVGRKARNVRAADALGYIAGFAVGIDLSARDCLFNPRHLKQFDLFGGKVFDDSCPLGPKITPAQFVDDANLTLKLWVNGDLKQNGNTRDMIWSLGEQIEAISAQMTLEPGDIILTGTPAGAGMATDTYLKVGDKIDAEIGNLGRMSIEIVEDATDAPH